MQALVMGIGFGQRNLQQPPKKWVKERGNTKKYHTQPRLFLSLKDTFDYIMRHDSKWIEDLVPQDKQEQALAMC